MGGQEAHGETCRDRLPIALLCRSVYIQNMRRAARSLLILTVLAVVCPLVPVLACGQAGGMPCCRPSVPCDLGIGTGECCRTMSAPAGSVPPGGATQSANPGPLLRVHGPSPISVDATPHAVAVLGFNRLWFPPHHDDSTPLFLRNASILR